MNTQGEKGIPVHSGLNLTFTIDDARLRCSRVVTQDLPPDVFAAPIFPPQGDHALNRICSAALEGKTCRRAHSHRRASGRTDDALDRTRVKTAQPRGPGRLSGGRVDAADGSPTITALREAEEEIGLMRDYVERLAISRLTRQARAIASCRRRHRSTGLRPRAQSA